MKPFIEFPAALSSKIRFVLTDVDDTLTDGPRLPAAAYLAVERLRDAGITVIPVTAAPAGWCDLMARMWPVGAVIGENGWICFRHDRAARFSAGVFRVPGRRLSESDHGSIAAALASSGPAPGLVSRTSGAVRAYWSSDALFPARSLASGWYVYAVRFAASMNPSRTALFVGTPFRAG